MNKIPVVILAVVFALSLAGTAFAAANPFVDVPAKHWAYESLTKLARAGIVDGYGDGTFRGDKTLTRYEMAVVVAKAMANQEKADSALQAEIAKLQAEFSDELVKLGVRVAALENKVGNITFRGEARTRYEWSKNSAASPQSWTRLRLDMQTQLTDDLLFDGKYEAESPFGDNSNANAAHLTHAYITGKALGFDVIIFGRQHLLLGQGLLADNDGPADGLVVGSGKVLQVVGGSLKAAGYTFIVGNIGWKAGKNLNISTSYAKDKDSALYKDWAAGFNYTGIKNLGITYEYGANGANRVKAVNNGSSAKAWMAKVKYLGAAGDKPKSYGLWVGYRKADELFDNFGFTTLANDQARASNVSSYALNGALNNVKGFQYGFEYTVFPNGIAKIMYNRLTDNTTGTLNGDNLICQLTYTF